MQKSHDKEHITVFMWFLLTSERKEKEREIETSMAREIEPATQVYVLTGKWNSDLLFPELMLNRWSTPGWANILIFK